MSTVPNDTNSLKPKPTIEECKTIIANLDRENSELSNVIHDLEKQLELQRANVDVLVSKDKAESVVQTYVLVFFLISFSIWVAFH